jgi:hypothetical protein
MFKYGDSTEEPPSKDDKLTDKGDEVEPSTDGNKTGVLNIDDG